MSKIKYDFTIVTRESVKAAAATGMTPEDFLREAGLPSVQKLYNAIRGLYQQKARAEKLIEALKANRKKPVMAAPVDDSVEAEAEEAPVKGKKAADKPATVPVAEAPAQDIKKPQNGAPENPASDPKFVSKHTKRAANIAKIKGGVAGPDYVVNFPEILKELAEAGKLVVPQMVLNNVRSLIKYGRVPAEVQETVDWLQKHAIIIEKAPADIVVVDSSVKPQSVLMAKHVINVRQSMGDEWKDAIVLTKSYEVRNLLSDYEAAHKE